MSSVRVKKWEDLKALRFFCVIWNLFILTREKNKIKKISHSKCQKKLICFRTQQRDLADNDLSSKISPSRKLSHIIYCNKWNCLHLNPIWFTLRGSSKSLTHIKLKHFEAMTDANCVFIWGNQNRVVMWWRWNRVWNRAVIWENFTNCFWWVGIFVLFSSFKTI